jgi:hypothetical protein
MQTKYQIIIGVVALIVAFEVGRNSAPEKVRVETKIEKQVVTEQVTHTVTKIIARPDGTKETVIVKDTDTDTKSNTEMQSVNETVIHKDDLNISLLAGAQPHLFQGVSIGPLVYGASVTKRLLGPVTIGAFGLSDLTVGVSLGLNF